MHIQTHLAVSEVMKGNTVTVKVTVFVACDAVYFCYIGVTVCSDVYMSPKLHGVTSIKIVNFTLSQNFLSNRITQ